MGRPADDIVEEAGISRRFYDYPRTAMGGSSRLTPQWSDDNLTVKSSRAYVSCALKDRLHRQPAQLGQRCMFAGMLAGVNGQATIAQLAVLLVLRIRSIITYPDNLDWPRHLE
jgi:hypothetical protein